MFAGPERTATGESTLLFFVRGIRHRPAAAETVSTLVAGDRLVLGDDQGDAHNSRALLLRVSDGQQVGWAPDYLVEHVHELRQLNGEDPIVIVEHVNDRSVAPHLRLLCRLSAPWPPGYVPFGDAAFQPLVDLA